MLSSATGFMANTTSSANSWCLALPSLARLGIAHRSYVVPDPTALPRVRTITQSLPTYLQYLHSVT
jgi:hypothetical protein